jgi:hypothetical protein
LLDVKTWSGARRTVDHECGSPLSTEHGNPAHDASLAERRPLEEVDERDRFLLLMQKLTSEQIKVGANGPFIF